MPSPTNLDTDTHLLTFWVDYHLLAFTLDRVVRLAHYPAMVQPAGRPEFLEGLVNFQGTATPVISLTRLLGTGAQEAKLYTPIIFLKDTNGTLGLLVDRLQAVFRPGQWQAQPVEQDWVFNRLLQGIASLRDNSQAGLLDPAKLLLEEEKARVDAFRQQATQRLAKLT